MEEISVSHAVHNTTQMKNSTLGSFGTVEDLWTWISYGVIPALAGPDDGPSDARGRVRTFNQVLGIVELRQQRLAMGGCDVVGSLEDYYRKGCRQDGQISVAMYGPAAAVSAAAADAPFSSQAVGPLTLDSAFLAGGSMPNLQLASDERFYAWLDLRNPVAARQRALVLWQNGWIDDSTREFEVRIPIFNAEIRAFALISIRVHFWRGGLLQQELKVEPVSHVLYPTTWHIIPDIIWAGLLVCYIFVLVQDVFDRQQGQGLTRACCGDPWMVLDWAAMAVGLFLMIYFLVFFQGLNALTSMALEVDSHPGACVTCAEAVSASVSRDYEGGVAEFIEQLDNVVLVQAYHRLGMFWYCMLILLRFFRGFLGQSRIAKIGRTLAAAGPDMFHLAIIMFVLFENFALGGYALFGPQLEDWSTFRLAQRSTLAASFGRLDFEAIHNIAPWSSVLWLVSFVTCIAFLLSNMLLAIIVDHHHELKDITGMADQHMPGQLLSLMSDTWWKFTHEVRMVRCFLARRMSPDSFLRRRILDCADEPTRSGRIPYDTLLKNIGGIDCSRGTDLKEVVAQLQDIARPPSWAPIREDLLRKFDIDKATAQRMIKICRQQTQGKKPTGFPVDRLFFEYEQTMEDAYGQLDALGGELKGWLAGRLVDCGNLEPRQKKLHELVTRVRPAPSPFLPVEYQVETMPSVPEPDGVDMAYDEDGAVSPQ